MNSKRSRSIAVIVAVFAVLILGACASQQGPILIETAYDAPQGLAPTPTKVVVGLSPFQDARGKKSSVVGERVDAAGQLQNELVIQGTVSEIVTAALRTALEARKIIVKDVPAWDLRIENLKAEGVDIVIGGSVTTLWAKAVVQPLNATTRAEVALHAAVADAKDKNVFRSLKLKGAFERQDMGFGADRVGQAISAALSQVLDQLMTDEEVKKKLQ